MAGRGPTYYLASLPCAGGEARSPLRETTGFWGQADMLQSQNKVPKHLVFSLPGLPPSAVCAFNWIMQIWSQVPS